MNVSWRVRQPLWLESSRSIFIRHFHEDASSDAIDIREEQILRAGRHLSSHCFSNKRLQSIMGEAIMRIVSVLGADAADTHRSTSTKPSKRHVPLQKKRDLNGRTVSQAE